MKKPKPTAVDGFQLSEAQRHLSAVRQALSNQRLSRDGVIILNAAEEALAMMDTIRFGCAITKDK